MLCSTTTKKAAGREKEGHKALDNIVHTQRAGNTPLGQKAETTTKNAQPYEAHL